MMKTNRRNSCRLLALVIWTAALVMTAAAPSALAQSSGGAPTPDPLAEITFASGPVGVWPAGGNEWTMVQGRHALHMGDHVRTGETARAVIEFADGSEVLMHEQTTLHIAPREPVEEPRGVAARVKVALGQIFNRVTPGESDLEFETPDAVAAIRGTEFFVQTASTEERARLAALAALFDADAPLNFERVQQLATELGLDLGTLVLVLSGQVDVFNPLGRVSVGAGERTAVRADQAPESPMPASSEELQEALEWAEEVDQQRREAGAEGETRTEGAAPAEDEADGAPEETDPIGGVPGTFIPASTGPTEDGDGEPGDEDPVPVTISLTGGIQGRSDVGEFEFLLLPWKEGTDPLTDGDADGILLAPAFDGEDFYIVVDEVRTGQYRLAIIRVADVIVGIDSTPSDRAHGGFASTDGDGSGSGFVQTGDGPVVEEPGVGDVYPVPLQRVGDVLMWMSKSFSVRAGQEEYDLGVINVSPRDAVDFELRLGNDGESEKIYGGADPEEGTFAFTGDVSGDRPLVVTWDLGGDLANASVLSIIVDYGPLSFGFGEKLEPTVVEVEGDADYVEITSLEAPAAQLILVVHTVTDEFVMLAGPSVFHEPDPYVTHIDPVRLILSDAINGEGLTFTVHGRDLFNVQEVRLIPVEAPPEQGSTLVIDWAVSSADGQTVQATVVDVAPGLYTVELAYASGNPHKGERFLHVVPSADDQHLLITSTDLSGKNAYLSHGDFRRSRAGLGPLGEITLVEWRVPDAPGETIFPHVNIVDERVVVAVDNKLAAFPLDQDGHGHKWELNNWEHEAITVAVAPGDASVYFVEEFGDSRVVAAQFLDADEREDFGAQNNVAGYDLLVHDGILVVAGGNQLVTYDAMTGTKFREITLDETSSTTYGLAISVHPEMGDIPMVYAVSSDGKIWAGNLYTLATQWDQVVGEGDYNNSYDFAVSPTGNTLYVIEWASSKVEIYSYDARTRDLTGHRLLIGADGRDWDDEGQWEHLGRMGHGVAVQEDGQLVILAVGTRSATEDSVILGFVLSPHLEDLHLVEGPKLEKSVQDAGLAVATNTAHAYVFLTYSSVERSEFYRFGLASEGSGDASKSGWEPIEVEEGPSGTVGIAVSHNFVWLLNENGSIYRIESVGEPDDNKVDPHLDKRADRTHAQIGDVITYTITFDNTLSVDDEPIEDQDNVWIQDTLPPGFIFVEGSSYVYPSGVGGTSPVKVNPGDKSTDRIMQFHLTDPAAGGTIGKYTLRALTYQAVVGPRVVEGATYTNEAVGYADGAGTNPGWLDTDLICPELALAGPHCDAVLTNVARADVHIVPGVFTPQGIVVGKVFHDGDGDGSQSAGEPGLGGAHIYMETGVRVVTDGFGKFSLSNLTPGLHVFFVDEATLTLPDASGGRGDTLRVAGGPYRLLDLTGGGLFTLNFPVRTEPDTERDVDGNDE